MELGLAMVDAGSVEDEYRHAVAVLPVVDRHVAEAELHPVKLPAQGARFRAHGNLRGR
jgi:hypothetical protein